MKSQYSKEFKEQAVELCLNNDKPDIEIADDLGVRPSTLASWKRKYLRKNRKKSNSSEANLTDAQKIKQLQRKLAIAEEERDILKKALAIFSSNPEEFTD